MKTGIFKRIVSVFSAGAFIFSSSESVVFAQASQTYNTCKHDLEPVYIIELSDEEITEVIRKIDEAYSNVDVVSDEKGSLYNYSTNYYYNQLDEAEKQLYDGIVEACEKFAASAVDIEASSSAGGYLDYVYYDGTQITKSEMVQIFHAVYYSNPQFYFLANGYGYNNDGTKNALVVPIADGSGDNFCLYSTRKAYSEKIEEITNEWMKEINACDTPLEKETLISEKICDYITYEKTGFHQSLAGALVGAKCVCNGYAMAMSYFCNASGIECIIVVSDNHAWNRVRLYDNWYEVDTTWMDQDDHIWYDWFNKSETSFTSAAAKGMHDIDTSYYENMFTLPSCTRDSVLECEHTGGTATCMDKAVCGICEAEYGEVDGTNHVNKSTEWSNDETGHWYTCDCGKVDFSAHISGGEATETEDETCTVCNYVIAPATGHIKHTADTSKWLSDGINHWHKCVGCDEKLDITTHSGGTATCMDKAKCGICEAEYGEVDATNHVNKSTEWSNDETGHWHTCDCGKVDFAEHISGGEATETEDEICIVCDYVIAPATGHIKHTADTSKWLSDGTNHWHKCIGCDEKLDITTHSGGTATCIDKAVCGICEAEYGEVDGTNHVNKSTEWSNDETGHWYTCDCGKVDFSAHISGGEATETEDEVCTICGYVIAPATGHIRHTADTSKWLSDGTNHWHKCIGCDEKLDITTHSGGTATCIDKAVCGICEAEYGEVDSTNHVNKSTEWSKDETGHWYTCDCGKVDFSAHISGGEATETEDETCTVCNYVIAPATGAVEETPIEQFVERLYVTMLGRASDPTGKANHVSSLNNGKTAAEVSAKFVTSAELKNKNLSNDEFVLRMYQTFMNRTPSAKEITRWATTLENGCTYEYVLKKFVASAEFKNLCAEYGITAGTYEPAGNRDYDENITAFVSRMYTTLLGRSFDASGLNNNAGIIINGGTAADVGKKFVMSGELTNLKLSNDEFVKRMYQTFLNRTPSAKEITRWATTLENGCSYGYILKKFVASAEFNTLCTKYGISAGSYETAENRDYNENITAYVSRMYTKALGRSFDINGLNNNTGRLITGEMTAAEVAEYFILSKEFVNKKLTDEQYVTTLYSALFNRAPDASGKKKWLNKLATGTSREEVLKGFTTAAEFKNLVASFGL